MRTRQNIIGPPHRVNDCRRILDSQEGVGPWEERMLRRRFVEESPTKGETNSARTRHHADSTECWWGDKTASSMARLSIRARKKIQPRVCQSNREIEKRVKISVNPVWEMLSYRLIADSTRSISTISTPIATTQSPFLGALTKPINATGIAWDYKIGKYLASS